MSGILYTIVIYPIERILELCFFVANWVFRNQGLAIAGISAAVSILTLPMYFMAERQQTEERATQKRLKPQIDRIKAVFRGDERQMILATLYRQHHYHPVFAMRNSLGLLIQIPFFVAAYSYLSRLESLNNATFLFIGDLSRPDGLLPFNGTGINLLPFVMTAINCIASAVYTKGFRLGEKIQLYGIALVFLVLLYNSPSGIVLYWTMNNVFSLVKNGVQKFPGSKKSIPIVMAVLAVVGDLYLIFFHGGKPITRILIGTVLSLSFVIVFVLTVPNSPVKYISLRLNKYLADNRFSKKFFIMPALVLFVHLGIVIPGSLIASSVKEFSFIDPYASPLPFVVNTALQTGGFVLFWMAVIYFLAPGKTKFLLTAFLVFASVFSLANTFLVPEKFGFLTTTMTFSEASQYRGYNAMVIWNVFLLIVIAAAVIMLFRFRMTRVLMAVQAITLTSLSLYGAVNVWIIQTQFMKYRTELSVLNTPPPPIIFNSR